MRYIHYFSQYYIYTLSDSYIFGYYVKGSCLLIFQLFFFLFLADCTLYGQTVATLCRSSVCHLSVCYVMYCG